MRTAFPSLLLLVAALLPAASPAANTHGSPLDNTSLAGENRYTRCQSLIKTNAHLAASAADEWHEAGGGAAALHCEALALVALHRYVEAATTLDNAAMAEANGDKVFREALFDQCGNAWLLAGQPQKAESSFDLALALSPKDQDALLDRARARAARKNWSGADSDLSAVLAQDPDRADILVLRASARHALGRKAEAMADIARALEVQPGYSEALVERGAMKLEAGDQIGARADWEQVVRDAPNGAAAAAARDRLADLDAKPDAK
jgi:tetratricopeptide (TPR) repeat protein